MTIVIVGLAAFVVGVVIGFIVGALGVHLARELDEDKQRANRVARKKMPPGFYKGF